MSGYNVLSHFDSTVILNRERHRSRAAPRDVCLDAALLLCYLTSLSIVDTRTGPDCRACRSDPYCFPGGSHRRVGRVVPRGHTVPRQAYLHLLAHCRGLAPLRSGLYMGLARPHHRSDLAHHSHPGQYWRSHLLQRNRHAAHYSYSLTLFPGCQTRPGAGPIAQYYWATGL